MKGTRACMSAVDQQSVTQLAVHSRSGGPGPQRLNRLYCTVLVRASPTVRIGHRSLTNTHASASATLLAGHRLSHIHPHTTGTYTK